jgi:hypothetical protein
MPRFDDLSAEELDQIRRFIEESDIDVIDDEMRELVEKHWPWLLAKLPPQPNSKGAGRSRRSHDPAPAELSRLVVGEPPGASEEL